eukprot:364165-Chlamydomonas_euryale.AAC.4
MEPRVGAGGDGNGGGDASDVDMAEATAPAAAAAGDRAGVQTAGEGQSAGASPETSRSPQVDFQPITYSPTAGHPPHDGGSADPDAEKPAAADAKASHVAPGLAAGSTDSLPPLARALVAAVASMVKAPRAGNKDFKDVEKAVLNCRPQDLRALATCRELWDHLATALGNLDVTWDATVGTCVQAREPQKAVEVEAGCVLPRGRYWA